MRRMAVLITAVLLLGVISVSAAEGPSEGDLEKIVKSLDSAVVTMRKGGSASSSISGAKTLYENKFSQAVAEKDNSLNQRILDSFDSLSQNPQEDNVFALKRDVITAAGLVGISISPLYSYSIFLIAGITLVLSLLITMINKRLVNWEMVNRYKAEVSQFMREYREAFKRQDKKRLHKLQPQLREIQKKQGVILSETMKPSLYYFIPLIILWYLLAGVFRGWVVAWLPFSIDLPIYGKWVACGFGWWYLLTFLAFSTILRAVLILEEKRPVQSTQTMSQGG